jgi:hypothetical protein
MKEKESITACLSAAPSFIPNQLYKHGLPFIAVITRRRQHSMTESVALITRRCWDVDHHGSVSSGEYYL